MLARFFKVVMVFSILCIVATGGWASPEVYTLGTPVSNPSAIGVDEYGRLYVLDKGRQSLMRFGLYGHLEKTWHDEYPGTIYWPMERAGFFVADGEKIVLSQMCGDRRVRYIGVRDAVDRNYVLPEETRVLAASCDGDMIVAAANEWKDETREVLIYSGEGEFVRKWTVPCFSDAAVGPDGLIYVTRSGRPLIRAYTPNGKVRRVIDLKPVIEMPPYTEHYNIDSICIDSNGDIYLLSWGTMLRLDKNGKLLARWNPHSADNEHPCSFARVAVRNGMVYTQTWNSSEGSSARPEFQLFTPDGQCVARYVPPKSVLNLPHSVAVQEDGSYAVAQRSDSADPPMGVVVFDRNGHRIGAVEGKPSVEAVLARPGGGYYVARSYSLIRVDQAGNEVAELLNMPPNTPYQIALNPAANCLWGLGWSGEIFQFGSDDSLIMRSGKRDETNFTYFSTGMAVGSDALLYLPDTRNCRIVKCDRTGKIVSSFGNRGRGFGEMLAPEGMVFDSEGRLYISDAGNCRISVFSTEGKPLGMWGRFGTGKGELNCPLGLAMGPGDVLYIADALNDRIVKIPLTDFWKQVTTEPAPESEPEPIVAAAAPEPGDVTVEGMVVAGSDDFTDAVFVENPQRAWGVMVTLPEGTTARRGECCQIRGNLEMRGRVRHIAAKSVDAQTQSTEVVLPLGMGNFCVGNGSAGPENGSLLVRTWGRVVSVDSANNRFVVSDGSSSQGLEVYAGELVSPVRAWPEVGDYVALTGISARIGGGPVLRVRCGEDIAVLAEQ